MKLNTFMQNDGTCRSVVLVFGSTILTLNPKVFKQGIIKAALGKIYWCPRCPASERRGWKFENFVAKQKWRRRTIVRRKVGQSQRMGATGNYVLADWIWNINWLRQMLSTTLGLDCSLKNYLFGRSITDFTTITKNFLYIWIVSGRGSRGR